MHWSQRLYRIVSRNCLKLSVNAGSLNLSGSEFQTVGLAIDTTVTCVETTARYNELVTVCLSIMQINFFFFFLCIMLIISLCNCILYLVLIVRL